MLRRMLPAAVGFFLVSGCSRLVPVEVSEIEAEVDYLRDIQPIFDARCAVCHSCYNSPCQLKLTSYEGVDRGASKIAVYSATRLAPQAPTRLFVDAESSAQWHQRGFTSVTENTASEHANDSLMIHLLAAKSGRPVRPASYEAESGKATCAADTAELGKMLRKHPDWGMPFGFPGLPRDDYDALATWLQRGAPGPSAQEQAEITRPSTAAQPSVDDWESFLNAPDPKHVMAARYLYEHLFLAHVVFEDVAPGEFYEVVRSTTSPGTPVRVVPTVRPYDDPGARPFYYRLRRIHATIVHKTHIVLPWTAKTRARYQQLFIDTPWLETPHVVSYQTQYAANPFVAYAQIPPNVRYQFMLDHAEYFMRTFIRGPVCKGQIALDVIHDHFWVLFLDPLADELVQHPELLTQLADVLRLPDEKGSDGKIREVFSNEYRQRYLDFYRAKLAAYERAEPAGFGLDAIWPGRLAEDSPLLTVYRHFDSASVHRGPLGDLPRTLWVIDYAQFERIYYALVAGFDVFGNVTHQVNVRRYMDYLRAEGELNFLEFLPRTLRMPTFRSWYLGDKAVDAVEDRELDSRRGTRIAYGTDDPKREFVERVIRERLVKSAAIRLDPLNYHPTGAPPMPTTFDTEADILTGLRALTAPGTDFIRDHDEAGADLAYVRVGYGDGRDVMFTIVVNRWHDNVNAMFGEHRRLDASRDTLDFIPGSIGSYPNYFFVVGAADIPDFFDLLANFDRSGPYLAKLRKYGVNRADPSFWETYDWFQARFAQDEPMTSGLYDLNRYYPLASPASP